MVRSHRRIVLSALLSCIVAACDCHTTNTVNVGKMVLTIDSPENDATFQTGETVDFKATATHQLGVKLLELHGGGADGVEDQTLHSCTPESGADPTSLTCDFPLEISQHGDLIGNGQITLTAIAFDKHGLKTKQSVVVHAKPIIVRIVHPDITPNSDPPVAVVSGSSVIEIQVIASLPITAVSVTDENSQVVTQWPANPTGPFKRTVIWREVPGVGQHRILAAASDNAGNVDSDARNIFVACSQDSDCTSNPGTRCCTEDGQCHQTVGENQICDCGHPCPITQGCFPGTCGATPQKCRPGCFPGGPPDATHPYGYAADPCPRQDGLPAYCSPLPADQVTTANKGGACAVGDDCSVTTQNCPDLPLDRTRPAGPDNPPVTQTCQPVAPGVNACKPAGGIAPWGINCDQVCSETANNCAEGYECVSLADSSGRQIGPSMCRKQCSNPGLNPSPDCPSRISECNKVYVAGMKYLSTGVCQETCFTNSDCSTFPATKCCNRSYGFCDVCP